MSDIAGTTRDAVDTEVIHEGTPYVFIDTAGLRRKSKIKEELERYSIIRTVSAVERADVVVVVIDATEGVTEQDAKIAGIAMREARNHVAVIMDAIEKRTRPYTNIPENQGGPVLHPIRGISLYIRGNRTASDQAFEMIDVVRQNQNLRVATGVLNEIMTEAVAMQQPPSDKGKRLKIYYMTQVAGKLQPL